MSKVNVNRNVESKLGEFLKMYKGLQGAAAKNKVSNDQIALILFIGHYEKNGKCFVNAMSQGYLDLNHDGIISDAEKLKKEGYIEFRKNYSSFKLTKKGGDLYEHTKLLINLEGMIT